MGGMADPAEKPLKKGAVADVDSDDSFLDRAAPRYQGRTPNQDSDAVDALLDKAKKGEIELPKLPPLVDH